MSTAQMAAQRFYNKGTGKMEAPHAGFNFHPVPAGHQMAKTNHVVTTHPAPAPKPAIDLAHMNDQQRLAFAQKLVGQELSAGRLPFQQNEQQLAGRETATRENVERLAGQGNQLGTQLVAGQKASGEAGEQRAREAATQAQIPQGPAEPPSRQDALLKALGQGGINAAANSRAAGEKWAQSQQSAYQQEGTAAIQNVGTRIGAERLKNRNNEAAYLAKGEGATTKLFTELTGEHDKLAAAEAANKLRHEELFGKEQQNRVKNALTARGQNVTLHGQAVTAQTAKEAREQKAQEFGIRTKQIQKRIDQGAKRIQQTAESNAAKTGLKLSPVQLGKVTEGLSGAFTTIERLRTENEDYGTIRQKLATGQEPGAGTPHYFKGKVVGQSEGKRIKVPKVEDGVVVRAAEEAWKYHAVSPQTLQQLAGKGLHFTSQREAYEVIAGRPYTPPKHYNTSGSNRAPH